MQDDDFSLFQAELRGVKPLKHDRADTGKPKTDRKQFNTLRQAATISQGEIKVDGLSDQFVIDVGAEDPLYWAGNGVQDGQMRKLKLGQIPFDGSLDLHGMSVEKARDTLWEFLAEATKLEIRCVRVTHGKAVRMDGAQTDDQKPCEHLAAPAPAGAGVQLLPGQARRHRRGIHHPQAHHDGWSRRVIREPGTLARPLSAPYPAPIRYPTGFSMSLEQQYTAILGQLGEDVSREGLLDTPKRAAKAMQYLCRGYQQTLEEVTNGALFSSDNSEMVLVKNIELYSLCEHHLLPFIGKAHVAYIPNGKVLGLSKVARIVDMYARRLQIQENLSRQIAEAIEQVTGALGVAVVIEAQHMCMMMRGVEKQNSSMVTSVMLGEFRSNPATRGEFLNLIR